MIIGTEMDYSQLKIRSQNKEYSKNLAWQYYFVAHKKRLIKMLEIMQGLFRCTVFTLVIGGFCAAFVE